MTRLRNQKTWLKQLRNYNQIKIKPLFLSLREKNRLFKDTLQVRR